MKVIRRTIFNEIDDELAKGGKIIKIQLTEDEFKKAIEEGFHYGKWHGFTKKSEYEPLIGDYSIRNNNGDYSGSKFIYKTFQVEIV